MKRISGTVLRRNRWAAGLLAATALVVNGGEVPAQTNDVQELRRLIQETRETYEERIRELESRLEALEKESVVTPPQPSQPEPAGSPRPRPDETEPSLEDVFKEIGAKPAAPAAAKPGVPAQTQPQTTEEIAKAVGQHEAPKMPWFRALNNPSFGVVGDVLGSFSDEDKAFDRRNRIDLRELELVAYGPIDPFGHASALISGAHGVSVEEGALTLTGLPANLQLRGGKFFADVSRLNKTHTHDLPFVEQPLTMQNFLGNLEPVDERAWWSAEPQFNAMGAELSWMVPTPFYWRLQWSAYNEFSDRSPGSLWDQYLGGPAFRRSYRGLDDFTYHFGTKAFLELSPDHSLRLFANVLVDAPTSDTQRTTESAGFTYLWFPLVGGLYKRFEWTTEAFANQERFLGLIEDQRSWGVYSYVTRQLGRKFDIGFLGEWSTFRYDDGAEAWHAGGWLSYCLSERQRFRFQLDRYGAQDWVDSLACHTGALAGDGNYWLGSIQWSVVLGSHEHTYE